MSAIGQANTKVLEHPLLDHKGNSFKYFDALMQALPPTFRAGHYHSNTNVSPCVRTNIWILNKKWPHYFTFVSKIKAFENAQVKHFLVPVMTLTTTFKCHIHLINVYIFGCTFCCPDVLYIKKRLPKANKWFSTSQNSSKWQPANVSVDLCNPCMLWVARFSNCSKMHITTRLNIQGSD